MKKLIMVLAVTALTAVVLSACGGGGGSSTTTSGPVVPIVTSVTPTANSTGISHNAIISAAFSTAMTASSINSASFVLSTGTATGSAVTGTVTYNALTTKATFAPTAAAKLAPATTYTALITTGAKDSVGTALASSYPWSFKTTHLDEYAFGTRGKVTANVGGVTAQTEDITYAIAVQADGKIVVAGDATESGDTPRYAIARYTTTGALDASFGTAGILWAPHVGTSSGDQVRAMAIDGATGKIMVAGWSDADTLVARYTTTGTPDNTFGTNGISVLDLSGTLHDDNAYAMAIQTTGNIIVGGSSVCGASYAHTCLALVRYNATNGNIDTSFGTNGVTMTDLDPIATSVRSIAFDTSNRIVVAATTGAGLVGNVGNNIVVARYLSTGVTDTSFGTNGNGYVVTNLSSYGDSAQAIAVQPADNKILVAGWVGHDAVVLRYNTDGTLDTSFGIQGRAVTDIGNGNNYAYALALQSDGKIVVAGTAPNPADSSDNVFSLMRYTAAGVLDATFENNGIALLNFTAAGNVDAAHAIAVTSGKIVIAGEAGGDFGVAQYVK